MNLRFEEFAGATAEAGDPDPTRNPFAPTSSKAAGDAFVHYVEHTGTKLDIIRFWFPGKPGDAVMPVEFEILQSQIDSNGGEIVVDDEVAIQLMIRVFFQNHCGDFYSKSISSFRFKRLGDEEIVSVPYPKK